MDFYDICSKTDRTGHTEIYPNFLVRNTGDLMVRGGEFYAVWDEARQVWSTSQHDLVRLIDEDLIEYGKREEQKLGKPVSVKTLSGYKNGSWKDCRNYIHDMWDNFHELDSTLTFSNSESVKTDYVSRRLPYPLEDGPTEAYDELMSTLYDPPERAKLEWAIGAILTGDARDIQKFVVLYGPGGSGKSTFLRIVEQLFDGYTASFDARALATASNNFAASFFKDNPLVAIQHDGDLSRIDDNTRLNSIVSHEPIMVDEKFKSAYPMTANCMLMIGTNSHVKISDSKSGIIRRLIDVKSSGRLVETNRYHILKRQIKFELGAIAYHCIQVYRAMGKDYYSGYKPLDMMYNTDPVYNFVWDNYLLFKNEDGVSLKQAYAMYKSYCENSAIKNILTQYKFRDELSNYFLEFHERARVEGDRRRQYYTGFLADKFESRVNEQEDKPISLALDCGESILDDILSDQKAQYANSRGVPTSPWDSVTTTLKDVDTLKEHYVMVPKNLIVIDFDLKDENGEKSYAKNLAAASQWPPTYTETSKSGKGIHLHYYYEGDLDRLSRLYDKDIEIKVFTGKASLRRKVIRCNNTPIATINSGLPLREEKMISKEVTMTEKGLRDLIIRNLNKEIHPGTKPSVDFIKKILDDMYESGKQYDVTDMRPRILSFAMQSSNQADTCVKTVSVMRFKSDVVREQTAGKFVPMEDLVIYDVEVFPNLLLICYKQYGNDNRVRLYNPTSSQVEDLLRMNLVGFNNRRYDNHILYGRYMGFDNEEIYKLSKSLINNSVNAGFLEAYNASYLDVWEMSSKKMTLKKFEIELGIHHQELGFDWDTPVPEEMWDKVGEYCDNDVDATEAVLNNRKADYTARLILSELSGLPVNEKTQNHTRRIIFGKDRRPQDKFVYTDLSKTFPGYKYDFGKSTYRGFDPSEGGFVDAETGIHEDVALLDVASLHPTSLVVMNYFGEYTPRFKELLDARLAIKHREFDKAREMLDGKLTPFLTDESQAKDLSYALKIAINIVYGMTSAKYDNPFRDPRNVDNIVAKRGALFMIDLKLACEERGLKVAHIKTDSIKIPGATEDDIKFVMDFGKKYGYTFEHEDTYRKMCLVNDAVYIALSERDKQWHATGAQFLHPYVFKTLFSMEEVEFKDLCETKTVQTAMFLEFEEDGEVNRRFVGKAGSFCPVLPEARGGRLVREKDDKYYAVGGTKGYSWLEAEMVETLGLTDKVDMEYFGKLADDAIQNIRNFGDPYKFMES